MLKKKFLNLGIGLLVALVSIFVILFSTIPNNDFNLATRDIEIEQINYSQSVQNILNKFSDSSNNMDGHNAVFNGNIKLDNLNCEIDFLAAGIEEITVKYSANYDLNQNLFFVTASYYEGNNLLQQTTDAYTPQYDEVLDDVYFEIDNTKITITEILDETKEECFVWFLPCLFPIIASLFVVATVPVILNPSFYEPVAEAIDAGAKTVWNWISSSVTPAAMTVSKYKTLTAAELNQVKQGPTNQKLYHLAYVNSSGKLQVSNVNLSWIESLALLNSVKPLNAMMNAVNGLKNKIAGVNLGSIGSQATTDANAMKNQSKIGIYTKDPVDAGKLAWAVGARPDSNGDFKAETHNTNVGSKYFYHFHDAAHTIHIWCGNPI